MASPIQCVYWTRRELTIEKMLVRTFTCRMGIRGRRSGGCWRSGARGGCGRLLIQINDGGGKVSFLGENGQGQRGEHKYKRCNDGKLAEKVCRSAAAEDGLAGAAERCTDFSTFAGLQQDRPDHEQADNDVNDDQ